MILSITIELVLAVKFEGGADGIVLVGLSLVPVQMTCSAQCSGTALLVKPIIDKLIELCFKIVRGFQVEVQVQMALWSELLHSDT